MKDFRVEVEFRDDDRLDRTAWAGLGCAVEHVTLDAIQPYEFRWRGASHFLTLNDIVLKEGETRLDNTTERSLLDLTGRLSFAPEDCPVSGWSAPARLKNSYTALFIDPALAREELDRPLRSAPRPELYFRDGALRGTLTKLTTLLTSEDPVDSLHAETLALLAALELEQRYRGRLSADRPAGLSRRQEKLVKDYVTANLSRSLTLLELGELVGLSRFHFSRLFAATFGVTPLAYVRNRRIEHAKALLAHPGRSLADVAQATGFSSSASFSNAFRKAVGTGPASFRRGQP